MDPEQHISSIFDAITQAVNGFDDSIPAIQRGILDEVELLLRDLDLSSGRISPSVQNLKRVARMQGKLERIVLEDEAYSKQINSYMSSFDKITELNAGYFKAIEEKFKPSSLLKEMQRQSMASTIESLTGAGIAANVSEPVYDLIRQNVTNGTPFNSLTKSLRDYIMGQGDTLGGLDRYVKQITTDALNQYSAQYMDIVSSDLGLKWAQYAGVRIETSRKFCIAMLRKKYYHKAEIRDMIKGQFPQFKSVGGSLYKNTGLPHGMIKGTNVETFPVYRGGYNCHHQPIAVSESRVPEKIRREVYAKYNIRANQSLMMSDGGKVPSSTAPK